MLLLIRVKIILTIRFFSTKKRQKTNQTQHVEFILITYYLFMTIGFCKPDFHSYNVFRHLTCLQCGVLDFNVEFFVEVLFCQRRLLYSKRNTVLEFLFFVFLLLSDPDLWVIYQQYTVQMVFVFQLWFYFLSSRFTLSLFLDYFYKQK